MIFIIANNYFRFIPSSVKQFDYKHIDSNRCFFSNSRESAIDKTVSEMRTFSALILC